MMAMKIPAKNPTAQDMAAMASAIMRWGEDDCGTFAHMLVAAMSGRYPAEHHAEMLDEFKEMVLKIIDATSAKGRA